MHDANFNWNGRRVLITGARGFVGAHLTRALAQQGACVTAHARNDYKPFPLELPVDAEVNWMFGDVAQHDELRRLVQTAEPEFIFHLAGCATGARKLELVLPSLHDDLASTVHILSAATEIGCQRVLITGSLEEPSTTSKEVTPSSPYAAAKHCGVAFARMFQQCFQTPVVTARIFMTYGPAQRREKVIPSVIRSLLENRAPQLASGRRLVDWIYIDDVVSGLMVAASMPGLEGQIVELGTGTLASIRTVVEEISRLSGSTAQPQFGALPDPAVEVVRAAAVEETAALMPWRPRVSLTEGLSRTIAWHVAQDELSETNLSTEVLEEVAQQGGGASSLNVNSFLAALTWMYYDSALALV